MRRGHLQASRVRVHPSRNRRRRGTSPRLHSISALIRRYLLGGLFGGLLSGRLFRGLGRLDSGAVVGGFCLDGLFCRGLGGRFFCRLGRRLSGTFISSGLRGWRGVSRGSLRLLGRLGFLLGALRLFLGKLGFLGRTLCVALLALDASDLAAGYSRGLYSHRPRQRSA